MDSNTTPQETFLHAADTQPGVGQAAVFSVDKPVAAEGSRQKPPLVDMDKPSESKAVHFPPERKSVKIPPEESHTPHRANIRCFNYGRGDCRTTRDSPELTAGKSMHQCSKCRQYVCWRKETCRTIHRSVCRGSLDKYILA